MDKNTDSGSPIHSYNHAPGVDSNRLLDDKTILDELADVLAGVGIGNLVDLVGIQPHLKMKGQSCYITSEHIQYTPVS